MIAYHGDEKLKQSVLAEMREHVKADRLVKGIYWENGKGCAVGCLIESGNHEEFESKFGIPKELAQLEDAIFEGLPNEDAMRWPIKFLDAFKTGKDYTKVWNKFAYWLLVDPEDGVIKFSEQKEIIQDVANLHKRVIEGDYPTNEEWYAAGAAAGAAARSAAWAAEWAAAGAAEWAAERADAYRKQRDKLLEIIREV